MKTIITVLFLISFTANAFELVNKTLEENLLIKDIVTEMPRWDKTTQKRVLKYSPILIKIAKEIKVDKKLLLSIAWAESHFNPEAESYVGALGIMQVKPMTQEYIFDKTNEEEVRILYTKLLSKFSDIDYSIISNLLAGSLYVKYLLKKYDGDMQKAVIAYNIGPTGTYRLIKKNENLNKHRYFIKISNNIVAMN